MARNRVIVRANVGVDDHDFKIAIRSISKSRRKNELSKITTALRHHHAKLNGLQLCNFPCTFPLPLPRPPCVESLAGMTAE